MDFDHDTYRTRLGLDASPAADAAGLEALHRGQVYRIPFENLDILLGRGISLEPVALFDKLIRQPRGGYCFELNGLFGLALDAFGFTRRPLLARVHFGGEMTSRAHLINLVTIDGQAWIADVGFGAHGLRAPLRLERDRPVDQGGLTYRLTDAGNFGTMLQVKETDDWIDLYSFDMEHVWPVDIETGNHFTSTHPSMFFTWARVVTMPHPGGRTTLMDFTLRDIADGEETVTILEPGAAYLAALESVFGIILDAPYAALPPTRDEA